MVVGEFTVETDVAVIGGGLAGCETALAAAARGSKVTLIDEGITSRGGLGGRGLAAGGAVARVRQHIAALGRAGADPAALRELAATLVPRAIDDARTALAARLDGAGVTVIAGHASFDNTRQLSIQNNPQVPRVRFRRAVIAVGTHPDGSEHPWAAVPGVASVDDHKAGADTPGTLLLVGTGPALLEVAAFHRSLGADVTWATETDQLVPALGETLDALVQRDLTDRGVRLRTGTMIERVAEAHDRAISVAWRGDGDRASFDAAVYAAPRVPTLDGLAIEKTQAHIDGGYLVVDAALRTSNPRILAVGDAVAPGTSPAAVPVQAHVAAATLAGGDEAYDLRAIPVLAHSDPAAGWCGITPEVAAPDTSLAVRTHDHNGEAVSIVHERETDVVVGLAAFGPDAEAQVARGVVAVEMGAVLEDLDGMAG